jgi:hypothetical protein
MHRHAVGRAKLAPISSLVAINRYENFDAEKEVGHTDVAPKLSCDIDVIAPYKGIHCVYYV